MNSTVQIIEGADGQKSVCVKLGDYKYQSALHSFPFWFDGNHSGKHGLLKAIAASPTPAEHAQEFIDKFSSLINTAEMEEQSLLSVTLRELAWTAFEKKPTSERAYQYLGFRLLSKECGDTEEQAGNRAVIVHIALHGSLDKTGESSLPIAAQPPDAVTTNAMNALRSYGPLTASMIADTVQMHAEITGYRPGRREQAFEEFARATAYTLPAHQKTNPSDISRGFYAHACLVLNQREPGAKETALSSLEKAVSYDRDNRAAVMLRTLIIEKTRGPQSIAAARTPQIS